MARAMERATEYADPVGLVLIPDTRVGERLARAMVEHEGGDIDEILRAAKSHRRIGMIPALNWVVPFDMALRLLECTASTARRSLVTPRQPGQYWLVVVGDGGNTYGLVELDRQPRTAHDGQNVMGY
jgi:hypothetical protein